ncbi:MAG: YggT family protein [Caulobacter sp.]
MGGALVWLINAILNLVILLVIIRAILSWLIAFQVINFRNEFVRQVSMFLDAVTDPMLRPIQRIMPRLGGVDLSPIVLILGLGFLQVLFNRTLAPVLISALG